MNTKDRSNNVQIPIFVLCGRAIVSDTPSYHGNANVGHVKVLVFLPLQLSMSDFLCAPTLLFIVSHKRLLVERLFGCCVVRS